MRQSVFDDSTLDFISDSVVVGSVLSGRLNGAIYPTSLFSLNVSTGAVSVRRDLLIENRTRQLFPVPGGFLYHQIVPGILLCDEALSCKEAPFKEQGSLSSSPSGRKLIIKNNHGYFELSSKDWAVRSLNDVVSSRTLQVLPGDMQIGIHQTGSFVFVGRSGAQKRILVDTYSGRDCCKFLDSQRVAFLWWPERALKVFGIDGREVYDLTVDDPWRAKIGTCLSGMRFLVSQLGYSWMNKLLNPFDKISGRPFNLLQVSVRDSRTGREIVREDCAAGTTQVALSPNGQRLAVKQGNEIRVVDLP